MSKVIKGSGDFVPASLISVEVEPGSSWGNITRKIEDTPPPPTPPAQGKETETTAADQFEQSDNSGHFDEDFSSPMETDVNISAQTVEEVQPAEPQIDLEQFAEEHFNHGVQAGIERMESDYGSSIRTLQSVCEQLNTIRDTILKNSMDEMVALVMKISEKILRKSIAEQKETVINTVAESIQQAVKSEEFIISVNPDDFEIIQTKSADFINAVSGLENIVVRSDSRVEPGGCLVESSNCTVDATIGSQLEIIQQTIKPQ